jgi:hypothetical protein
MAGLANPVLTLTQDRAAKTVLAVATCRILFNPIELTAMQQGTLQFMFRAKLIAADLPPFGPADDLFTFTPPKIYPDATPNGVEEARFEATLGEEVLDEDYISRDEVFARFELTNLSTGIALRRNSPQVSGRF